MPYNFYIQVVCIKKTACRSDMRFLRYKALKSVMGSGRVGPGREYSYFSLKYERTRSARSLVIMWLLFRYVCLPNWKYAAAKIHIHFLEGTFKEAMFYFYFHMTRAR